MNIIKNARLYYHSIRHLKFVQVYFQILYRIKKIAGRKKINYKTHVTPTSFPVSLVPSIPSAQSYSTGQFTFLNKQKRFVPKFDWDFKAYGKLWTYNLNYFDFLNQHDMNVQTGNQLVDDFCIDFVNHMDAHEPYPTSLRVINWIKFFSFNGVRKPEYDKILFFQCQHLAANLEYHILGNHLLENGFSLLFAAYYYHDDFFYKKARKILYHQLHEQILSDGSHFELSPMYHQIILFRLLDSINLVKHNDWNDDSLLQFLTEKASWMLGWLNLITFNSGEIPMVNDAAPGIAPSSAELCDYVDRLKISPGPGKLSDSGYRMVRGRHFELFVDIGSIGPDYIPGHAHSDTFNFLLYVDGNPIIVDTGTSTYERGPKRLFERSTASHNTVLLNDRNQSEVWSSFRVGRRAKIIKLRETEYAIEASHDGYKSMGVVHTRTWQWNEREISITDSLKGKKRRDKAVAYLHFSPAVEVRLKNETVVVGPLQIRFEGGYGAEVADYEFARGFNKTVAAKVLKVNFDLTLKTIMAIAQ